MSSNPQPPAIAALRAELARLLIGVEPGPWKWFHYPSGAKLLAGQTAAVIHCLDSAMSISPADCEFIAGIRDLAPQLLAALDHLSARPEAGETAWCSMETAPTDTFVLLWWPHWSSRPVVGYRRFRTWTAEHFPTAIEDPPPTHWMPLPPAPAVSQPPQEAK